MYNIEHKLLFHPVKLDKHDDLSIHIHRKNLKEIAGDTISLDEYTLHDKKDKVILNMIYYKNPNVKTHIIYAHGNAGNIKNRIDNIYQFAKLANYVLFDYRGFGKSTGIPTEYGIYRDIFNVWRFLVYKMNIHPNDIILFGHSLGASIAAWLGQYLAHCSYKPKCIIMEAGFSSLKNIVADKIPAVAPYLIHNNFNSIDYVRKIGNQIPILILHSPTDEMINIKHMMDLCGANKNMIYYVINGTHNYPDIDDNGMKLIESFI